MSRVYGHTNAPPRSGGQATRLVKDLFKLVEAYVDELMTRPEALVGADSSAGAAGVADPVHNGHTNDAAREQAYVARFRHLVRPSIQEDVVDFMKRQYRFLVSLPKPLLILAILSISFALLIVGIPVAVCLCATFLNSPSARLRILALGVIGTLAAPLWFFSQALV
jgi:hypothetical protein